MLFSRYSEFRLRSVWLEFYRETLLVIQYFISKRVLLYINIL